MKNRSLAFAIDLAICAAPIAITLPLAIALGAADSPDSAFAAQAATLLGILFSIIFLLLIHLVQGLRRRPTPGQSFFSLQVTDKSNNKLASRKQFVARLLVGMFLVIVGLFWPPLFLLYPAWILIDKQGRSPMDLASNSQISHIP